MDELPLDFKACVLCRKEEGYLPYFIPPPWASLDARVQARMHEECYWAFVNTIRLILRLPPINISAL